MILKAQDDDFKYFVLFITQTYLFFVNQVIVAALLGVYIIILL